MLKLSDSLNPLHVRKLVEQAAPSAPPKPPEGPAPDDAWVDEQCAPKKPARKLL